MAADWDLSCPDWQARIRTGRSLIPALPGLFLPQAAKAELVFNRLQLADVPGTPTMAEAAGDWFRDIVRALHGSLDPATHERFIQEVFLLVPKKNSKTTNGATLMLTSLLINRRPNAKFILVAPTQDISEMAFRQVEGAVLLDPGLRDRLHVQVHLKKVTDRKTRAFLEVMSFDPNVLTGQKHSGCLIDELHVVGGSAKAPSAIGQLRGGMVSFPESFLVFITTQSEKPPAGVFKAELAKARAIRDGRQPGRMLPVLYEFPDEVSERNIEPSRRRPPGQEPWRHSAVWHMVTPNAGRSIEVKRLVRDFAELQSSGEEEIRRWASQHLNLEIGLSLGSDRWAGADHWEKQTDPTLTFETLLERCDCVTAGIDGGGLDDLLGLAIVGRERVTRKWLTWSHAWAHTSVLERRKSEAARLLDFEAAGELTIVTRMEAAFDDLAAYAAQIDEAGLLATVGLDPHGVSEIVAALAVAHIDGAERVVGVSQGYQMTGTVKTAEVKLSDGNLWHCGQALMAWCVGNAKVEPRGNAVIVTKQASGTGKIDPLMALFDAVALMGRNPEPARSQSAYNSGHDLLAI